MKKPKTFNSVEEFRAFYSNKPKLNLKGKSKYYKIGVKIARKELNKFF